eukprot:251589_1
MTDRLIGLAANMNICSLLERRKVHSGLRLHPPFRSRECVSLSPLHTALVERLAVSQVLSGHEGCVNRLAWNSQGTLLASVSDDCRIMLWNANSSTQSAHPLLQIESNHSSNIFGVRFIPGTCDRQLVTGAMDSDVRIHDISGHVLSHTEMNSRSSNRQSSGSACVRVFHCHCSRVKDVATCEHVPFVCWSASEDGTCRRFDLREKHVCGGEDECSSNLVADVRSQGNRTTELKGLSLNPVHPEYVI